MAGCGKKRTSRGGVRGKYPPPLLVVVTSLIGRVCLPAHRLKPTPPMLHSSDVDLLLPQGFSSFWLVILRESFGH